MLTLILETEARMDYRDLTLLDIAILAFATQRMTRLFVNDAATKWFREQFWDAKESRGKILIVKPASGPRRTLADLTSCPWCFGAWSAAVVTFFYLLTHYADFPVLLLAIAGLGTWIHQLAQLTGWRAQHTKNLVE